MTLFCKTGRAGLTACVPAASRVDTCRFGCLCCCSRGAACQPAQKEAGLTACSPAYRLLTMSQLLFLAIVVVVAAVAAVVVYNRMFCSCLPFAFSECLWQGSRGDHSSELNDTIAPTQKPCIEHLPLCITRLNAPACVPPQCSERASGSSEAGRCFTERQDLSKPESQYPYSH